MPHPYATYEHGIEPGLYIIHWKSGGSSKAAIGMNDDGTRWIAATNWCRPATDPELGVWAQISGYERIEAPVDIDYLETAELLAERVAPVEPVMTLKTFYRVKTGLNYWGEEDELVKGVWDRLADVTAEYIDYRLELALKKLEGK